MYNIEVFFWPNSVLSATCAVSIKIIFCSLYLIGKERLMLQLRKKPAASYNSSEHNIFINIPHKKSLERSRKIREMVL